MIYRPVLVLIFLFAGAAGIRAQEPWQPDHKEMLERYRHAKAMEEATRNTVFRASVQPHWQADGSSFWYRNVLKDSVLEYIYVQPFAKKKQPAFDHMKLAEALGRGDRQNAGWPQAAYQPYGIREEQRGAGNG